MWKEAGNLCGLSGNIFIVLEKLNKPNLYLLIHDLHGDPYNLDSQGRGAGWP